MIYLESGKRYKFCIRGGDYMVVGVMHTNSYNTNSCCSREYDNEMNKIINNTGEDYYFIGTFVRYNELFNEILLIDIKYL